MNDMLFNSIFATLYFNQKDNTHLLSFEAKSGIGRIDHIFIPTLNLSQ